MSGAVEVIKEPDGAFVVACFRTDCWEHGVYGHGEPWVIACASRAAAQLRASEHRREIREQGETRCPTCNRPPTTSPERLREAKSTTDTSPSDGAREDRA